MIDYGVLPPEINSGRMYAGAGSGPMLAAATAWDVLADELNLTAASFESTVLDLSSGPWRGPTAMSMAAAALPFATWFKATSAQAEHAATQAKAAAAAYETAFAMTVPPQVVATNRAQLMMLIATNFFGQNTPAIAATEAHYAAMWAQDAAAMYGYIGSSTTASKFSEFTAPPQTTNSVAPSAQAGTAAHSFSTAPVTSTMPAPLPVHPTSSATIAPQVIAQLGSSSTPPAVPGAPGSVTAIKAFLDQWTSLNRLAGSGFSPTPLGDAASQTLITWEHSPNAYTGVRDVLADGAKAAESAAKGVGTAAVVTPATGSGLPAVGLAKGIQIGSLSVPPSWPTLPGAANPAGATLVTSRVAVVAAAEGLPRSGFGVPGVPGMTAAGGAAGFRFVPRYGYRHKVMNRPPGAG